jgi:cytochrome d ubiquinol oxidase subunit II
MDRVTGMLTLANFWAAVLALALLLYVVLDGLDLGIGMLFGFTRSELTRRHMVATVSPVWDGNETWLVVSGSVLFAAFPMIYAVLLSAFYLPLCLMLAALILRGVAFEFREKAGPIMRRVWDFGFAGGSFVAAFMQGSTVGALVRGLPVGPDGRFLGHGAFDWLSPFALLCGLGLCLGDALLGAAWLVLKSEGETRDRGYRMIPRLLSGVLAFLACAFAYSLEMNFRVMHRWIERPWLAAFPAIGLLAVAALMLSVRRRRDLWPFVATTAIFSAAFATLAASFLPYMIPYSVTVTQAAAPRSSLAFLFWGAGLFVLPLILLYNVTAYAVFRGKTRPDAHHYD